MANDGSMLHPMHLHGYHFEVVAQDGFPLEQPYMADTLVIAPGQRFDVLVHAVHPGAWAFHCHILPHVEGPQGMYGMVTALVVVQSPPRGHDGRPGLAVRPSERLEGKARGDRGALAEDARQRRGARRAARSALAEVVETHPRRGRLGVETRAVVVDLEHGGRRRRAGAPPGTSSPRAWRPTFDSASRVICTRSDGARGELGGDLLVDLDDGDDAGPALELRPSSRSAWSSWRSARIPGRSPKM